MSAPQLLFSNDFITISQYADPGYLHADWCGYQTVQSIQEGFNTILTCMLASREFHILNDNRRQKGIWTDAAGWVATQWFPRMRLAGMRRLAWIYSPSRFSQVSVDAVLNAMDPGSYSVRVYHDAEEALRWLLEPTQSA